LRTKGLSLQAQLPSGLRSIIPKSPLARKLPRHHSSPI
jgi:hypothetical protein